MSKKTIETQKEKPEINEKKAECPTAEETMKLTKLTPFFDIDKEKRKTLIS